MEQSTLPLRVDLKAIEAFVNEDVQRQKAFLSRPQAVFEYFDVALSDSTKEQLDEFVRLISTKARIADPVTMIYE
jgi:hypothetical protein